MGTMHSQGLCSNGWLNWPAAVKFYIKQNKTVLFTKKDSWKNVAVKRYRELHELKVEYDIIEKPLKPVKNLAVPLSGFALINYHAIEISSL